MSGVHSLSVQGKAATQQTLDQCGDQGDLPAAMAHDHLVHVLPDLAAPSQNASQQPKVVDQAMVHPPFVPAALSDHPMAATYQQTLDLTAVHHHVGSGVSPGTVYTKQAQQQVVCHAVYLVLDHVDQAADQAVVHVDHWTAAHVHHYTSFVRVHARATPQQVTQRRESPAADGALGRAAGHVADRLEYQVEDRAADQVAD